MDDLSIHVRIQNQYQFLDATGQLPFHIVFGLCRRSPRDTDARPLILHTAKSALDVPYGLSHGLLTLQGESESAEIDVDISSLPSESGDEGTYLTLPSRIDRTTGMFDSFTVYRYRVDPRGALAAFLQPGRKFTIRLASRDLGVKWWTYDDGDGDNKLHGHPPAWTSETAKLVSSKPSTGKATFKVIPSLPWPPEVETHMRLCPNKKSVHGGSTTTLEISMLNRGTRTIVAQTRGRQRFLKPWGPFQPEEWMMDERARIINGDRLEAAITSLKVVDVATDEVVRKPRKPGPCGPLYSPSADNRPGLDCLVTLKPGEPLVRRGDINGVLAGLPDGRYDVRLVPKGMWWCLGGREEIADEGDVRVPRRFYKTCIPPLMLKTDDFVELRIEGGEVVA